MKSEASIPIPTRKAARDHNWPIRLFRRSVLKQRKYSEIIRMLGETDGLKCLDIGSDNGVISYLLRQRGGKWKSADLDDMTVRSITDLVGTDVYQIDGDQMPFSEGEFDSVVIVDFLEHIPDDRGFVQEIWRVLKTGGTFILIVPHLKDGLMRKLRYALGQTDEKHGHLRPGYTLEMIRDLLGERFQIERSRTYSRFFSELIDTFIVFGVTLLKGRKQDRSQKGLVVTGKDLKSYQAMFKVFTLIYPIVWIFSKLDGLLFFRSGYFLILRTRVIK
jgi:SAM-dependent methyltransferase